VRCNDNTLYTGYCKDVEARVKKHNLGTAAKYTRCRRPVTLVYVEHNRYSTRSDAMKREYKIKQLSRAEKEILIKNSK
jgi:putative endonuclease